MNNLVFFIYDKFKENDMLTSKKKVQEKLNFKNSV